MNWRDMFSWFKTKEQTNNPSKQEPRRPTNRDWTDRLVANKALTQGIFHGSYPGMKLASAMAFTPIAVPIWFMGLPTPKTEDEGQQDLLDEYVERYSRAMAQVHLQCHREGTIWIWPHYSAKKQIVVWEFIPDDVVTDIVRDLDTMEITKVVTDEQIKVATDYEKTVDVRRRRTFTVEKITVEWLQVSGVMPDGLKSNSSKNPLGSMPVVFANNQDGDEVRGHSDYERILPDLKDYHDISLKRSAILAKFEAKLVQTTKNFGTWMANNGWSSIREIDIEKIDLIVNVGEEKTEFVFPSGAHEAYETALKNLFRKLVEGSGVPEILWGTKVEGNRASAEEQMDNLVKFVEEKRAQKTDAYKQLFSATLALESGARMDEFDADVELEWNALDAISESTKATIFSQFASGISALVNSAVITKAQVFALWRELYPNVTEDDYEKFVVGISEVAKHKAFAAAPYETIMDLEGYVPEELANQKVTNVRRVNYSPDQPRDEGGRFGEGGGSSESAEQLDVKKDSLGKIKGASNLKELSREATYYGTDYDWQEGKPGKSNPFNRDQVNALQDYGQGGSGIINAKLRAGTLTDNAEVIQDAFKSAPKLVGEVEVYRGGTFDPSMLNALEKGSVIEDKAFLSTTYSKDIAKNFSTWGLKEGSNKEPVMFTIRAKKGTPYIKMSGLDDELTTGEAEILFKAGSKLRVESIEKDASGVWQVKTRL